jgi:hypothetical protein
MAIAKFAKCEITVCILQMAAILQILIKLKIKLGPGAAA